MEGILENGSHQPTGLQSTQTFVDAVHVPAGVTDAAFQDLPVLTGGRD
jgi:hypothetical protein